MIKPFKILYQNQFWNNLIFQNRNKIYGAYELRNTYSSRMTIGILLSIFIFLILLLTPIINTWIESLFYPEKEFTIKEHEFSVSEFPQGNLGVKKLPLLSKSTQSKLDQDNSPNSKKEILNPKITKEEKVNLKKEKGKENNKVTEQYSADTKSDQSQSGVPNGSVNSSGDSTNNNRIYQAVGHMPVFAGCSELGGSYSEQKKCSDKRLLGFLKSNIRYPQQAIKNKTKGVVLVQFIVEKNGSVSNIKVVKEIGDGCGAETIRVLELLNSLKLNWSPGYQASTPVRVQYTLPVEFEGP